MYKAVCYNTASTSLHGHGCGCGVAPACTLVPSPPSAGLSVLEEHPAAKQTVGKAQRHHKRLRLTLNLIHKKQNNCIVTRRVCVCVVQF